MENLVEYPKPEVAKTDMRGLGGGGVGGAVPLLSQILGLNPQTVTSPAWNRGLEVTPEAGTPGGSWLPPSSLSHQLLCRGTRD